MSIRHRRTRCRILSIASPRTAAALQPAVMPAVVGGHSVINLAELARAIAEDRTLSCRVIEAAIQEFGCPGLSVEQAIVLLGRERLASQFLRLPHTHRMARARNNEWTEPFQEETE